jgi:hypothetical protein
MRELGPRVGSLGTDRQASGGVLVANWQVAMHEMEAGCMMAGTYNNVVTQLV